ncbi:unnamed protein product [Adineta steineri]|uniref:DUF2480 family protein n=1 Tax=Adineta steineri TaxID=433720 RepID=A0A815PXG9_9BILA|nr:unnamed protein product [Adineta steineri]
MEAEGINMNRVAESSLITLDLERFYPKEPNKVFDLKDYLFRGLIIKEKEFREALKNTDWQPFADCNVAVFCSTDAIIPVWAYMLIATNLQSVANNIFLGDEKQMIESIILHNISALDIDEFKEKRVVVKGCGDIKIPDSAYLKITAVLLPHFQSSSRKYHQSPLPVPINKLQSQLLSSLHSCAGLLYLNTNPANSSSYPDNFPTNHLPELHGRIHL